MKAVDLWRLGMSSATIGTDGRLRVFLAGHCKNPGHIDAVRASGDTESCGTWWQRLLDDDLTDRLMQIWARYWDDAEPGERTMEPVAVAAKLLADLLLPVHCDLCRKAAADAAQESRSNILADAGLANERKVQP